MQSSDSILRTLANDLDKRLALSQDPIEILRLKQSKGALLVKIAEKTPEDTLTLGKLEGEIGKKYFSASEYAFAYPYFHCAILLLENIPDNSAIDKNEWLQCLTDHYFYMFQTIFNTIQRLNQFPPPMGGLKTAFIYLQDAIGSFAMISNKTQQEEEILEKWKNQLQTLLASFPYLSPTEIEEDRQQRKTCYSLPRLLESSTIPASVQKNKPATNTISSSSASNVVQTPFVQMMPFHSPAMMSPYLNPMLLLQNPPPKIYPPKRKMETLGEEEIQSLRDDYKKPKTEKSSMSRMMSLTIIATEQLSSSPSTTPSQSPSPTGELRQQSFSNRDRKASKSKKTSMGTLLTSSLQKSSLSISNLEGLANTNAAWQSYSSPSTTPSQSPSPTAESRQNAFSLPSSPASSF